MSDNTGVSDEMSSDDQGGSTNSFWSMDTLTKALAIAAVLVPAVGFVIRYLRFNFDPAVGLDPILASSTLNLLVTGGWSVAISLSLGIFWIYVYGRMAIVQGHLNEANLEFERSGLSRVDFDELKARNAVLAARGQALVERQDRLNERSQEIETLGSEELATLSADLAASKADLGSWLEDRAALEKEIDDLNAASVRTKDARAEADRAMGRLGKVQLPARFPTITRRRLRLGTFGFYVIAAVVLSLFAPLIAVVARLGGLLLAGEMGTSVALRGAKKVPVAQLLPMVAVIVFSAAVSDGLWTWQSQGRFVTFDGVPQITNGWYGELGIDSNNVYLQSCDDPNAPVVAVPIGRVTSVRYAPVSRIQQLGTLGDFWAGRFVVGYVRGCTHPTNP